MDNNADVFPVTEPRFESESFEADPEADPAVSMDIKAEVFPVTDPLALVMVMVLVLVLVMPPGKIDLLMSTI